MLFNKNEVRKASEKKVLHKSGKNWIVLSSALLLALAGGAAVSSQSTSANADGITQQTANEVASLEANNYQPASSAAGSKASAKSASAPSKSNVNYNNDNGGSAASEHANVNYDNATINYYGPTVKSYVNSLNGRFPKLTQSLESNYQSASAKSSNDASAYNYYSGVAANKNYSSAVSSLASSKGVTASQYVDSVSNEYTDLSVAASSATNDIKYASQVKNLANAIHQNTVNNTVTKASMDTAAIDLTYADKRTIAAASAYSAAVSASDNAQTNYIANSWASVDNSANESFAVSESADDASFVNSVDASDASNTSTHVNAGSIFSNAISNLASIANAGRFSGTSDLLSNGSANNDELSEATNTDSAATVSIIAPAAGDYVIVHTDNAGHIITINSDTGTEVAGTSAIGSNSNTGTDYHETLAFNISSADASKLQQAIQDTAFQSAYGSVSASATKAMSDASNENKNGSSYVASASAAYSNAVSDENNSLSNFDTAAIVYQDSTGSADVDLYNEENVTISGANGDPAMASLYNEAKSYAVAIGYCAAAASSGALANGARFAGSGTSAMSSSAYALGDATMGDNSVASAASNALGGAGGTNTTDTPGATSSAASDVYNAVNSVVSNINSAKSSFASYSNNAHVQLAMASVFASNYGSLASSDSSAVSSASDALSNFYANSANSKEAAALNAYNSAEDALPNDEDLAHAYGVNVQNNKPKYITTTKDAVLHSNPAFALKADKHLARIPSNTELNVINVGFDVVGNVRYYVKYGKQYGYITANPYFSKSTYLEPLDNIDVVLDHNIKGYNDVLFKNPNGKTYKAGTELDGVNAVREDHYYEGFTRIQLNDGSYITSNTNWVHVVNNGANNNANDDNNITNNSYNNPNDNSSKNGNGYNMFWN